VSVTHPFVPARVRVHLDVSRFTHSHEQIDFEVDSNSFVAFHSVSALCA
jgi:hypothetical protein